MWSNVIRDNFFACNCTIFSWMKNFLILGIIFFLLFNHSTPPSKGEKRSDFCPSRPSLFEEDIERLGPILHEISKMAAVSEQWCISTRIFLILVILSTSANVHGWDSIDLELFDLVEEVKDNFYGVLGLKQVSTVVYFYFGWFWPPTGRILLG